MRYLLLLIIPFVFCTCKSDEEFLFKMEYEQQFEIQAGLGLFLTHNWILEDVVSNRTTYLNTFGTAEPEITSINPGNARIDALFSDAEYSIVDEISVRVYEEDPSILRKYFIMKIFRSTLVGV